MNNYKELEIGGISFGLSSGVITTLAMIIGMSEATGDAKLPIITGILTIAIADGLSDALGMYFSEESRLDEQDKSAWIVPLFTFLAKFVFSSIFIIPFLLLPASLAIYICLAFGIILIISLASLVARRKKVSLLKEVSKQVFLTVIVISASLFIGKISEILVNR